MATAAIAMPSTVCSTEPLSWSLSTRDFAASLLVDPINSTLRDEDVNSSDAESTACTTPTGLPPSVMKTASDTSTPSTVTAVDDATGATWITTARPQRRKRKRMSAEERRVRHREVQRQFMKRKRVRITELRKIIRGVENQLRFVTMLSEIEQLQKENQELQKKSEAVKSSPASMSIKPCTPTAPMDEGLVFSLTLPEVETHDDVFISEMDWNEIFDALSDDGATESDSNAMTMD